VLPGEEVGPSSEFGNQRFVVYTKDRDTIEVNPLSLACNDNHGRRSGRPFAPAPQRIMGG
jgi:hypothetical protein